MSPTFVLSCEPSSSVGGSHGNKTCVGTELAIPFRGSDETKPTIGVRRPPRPAVPRWSCDNECFQVPLGALYDNRQLVNTPKRRGPQPRRRDPLSVTSTGRQSRLPQIIKFVLIRIIVSLFNPMSTSYPFLLIMKGHIKGKLSPDFLFGLL